MQRTILAPMLDPSTPQPTVPRRKFLGGLLAGLAGGTLFSNVRNAFAAPAATQAYQPFVGELSIVGFNFAPVGWALCDGTLLTIVSNTALFSLLGTFYGGDGISTFALPDLRGRFPMCLSPSYPVGGFGGEATHTLNVNEIPAHAHSLTCNSGDGSADQPAGAIPARNPAGIPTWTSLTANSTLAPGAMSNAGGGLPHNNLPPYLSLNFIIATQGIFPARA